MKKLILLYVMALSFNPIVKNAIAIPGFSIQGGLIYDKPSQQAFREMEAGIGYMGSLGFDFSEKLGVELGVTHSTHNFIYSREGNAIRERDAEKNTLFIKAHAIPYRIGKANLVIAAGPAFFDISGPIRIVDSSSGNIYEMEAGFSGWGAVVSMDFRLFVTGGLTLTLYLSANYVRYNKYSLNSLDTGYPGGLPRGDSISWGLTIFHRIGMPKF